MAIVVVVTGSRLSYEGRFFSVFPPALSVDTRADCLVCRGM